MFCIFALEFQLQNLSKMKKGNFNLNINSKLSMTSGGLISHCRHNTCCVHFLLGVFNLY